MVAVPRQAYYHRQIENALCNVSEANRNDLVRFLEAKYAAGVKQTTLRLYATWLQRLDASLGGISFTSATADHIAHFLAQLRSRGMSESSLLQGATYLKSAIIWLHGDARPPTTLVRAFRIIGNPQVPHFQPITEIEYEKLMTHATTIRDKAIIAALRDTGFRASELLALNTDSIAFDGRGGARITLPASAPALKTGPRSVYVIRAAPILRALVALRNIDTGSPAPLFASKSKRSLGQRLKAHNLPRLIRSLCEEAGIRALWPHLFRHTRVTEAARNHWNEAQMRLFFGWSRFSKMPSHYSHLSIEDLERTILQEAKRPAITHLDEAAALLPVFMKFLGAIEGRNVLPRGLRPLPSRATTA